LALPEAALAPMLLLVILLVTPWVPETVAQGSAGAGPAREQTPTPGRLATVAILCGLAPLLWLDGLAVPAAAAALLYSRGLWRQALLAAAAGVGGLALFAVYGLAAGHGQFAAVLGRQREAAGGPG